MANAAGTTHNKASAILQSNINSPIPTNMTDITAPNNSGIKCENAVSKPAQSDIIVVVRSDKSLFPKNDNGIFLSFSAIVSL